MDSAVVTFSSKPVTSPPGLFIGTSSGIKSSQCIFLVGNKVSFPRQRFQASQKARRSVKQVGALDVSCTAEKILIANRGEIAMRVIRTAHDKLRVRLHLYLEMMVFIWRNTFKSQGTLSSRFLHINLEMLFTLESVTAIFREETRNCLKKHPHLH